jgi:hypothetical protein
MATNYKAWMSTYKDTPLKQLSIPGSHDAGMYEISWSTNLGWVFAADNAQTQNNTILQQLEAGIRYFDLRPGRVIDSSGNETYYTGHFAQSIAGTVGSTGVALSEVMTDVLSFLNECGSNEVIILKFSHYFQVTHQGGIDNTLWDDGHHDSVFTPIKQHLVDYVAETLTPSTKGNTTKWLFETKSATKRITDYTPNEITQNPITTPSAPVTYQARVIAVFDKIPTLTAPSTATPNFVTMPQGTYYYADMVVDSSKSPNDIEVKVAPNLPTGDFVVYDCYSNTNDYKTMCKGQLTKFNTSSYHSGDFYLMSWTLTLQNLGHVFDKIADLAETANNNLKGVVDEMIRTNQIYCNVSENSYMIPNIVYVDYVDTFVTDVCIEINEWLASPSWYGSLQNNANSQYRCNNATQLESNYSSPNCLIDFQLQSDGSYGIKNMGNNQYYQSSITTMVNSIAGENQKWNLIHISDNQYYVQNVGNKQYMTRKATKLVSSNGSDEVWNIENRNPS